MRIKGETDDSLGYDWFSTHLAQRVLQKGIMLSDRNLVVNGELTLEVLGITSKDKRVLVISLTMLLGIQSSALT